MKITLSKCKVFFGVFLALVLFSAIADNYWSLTFGEDELGETIIEAYLNQTRIISVNNPTRVAIANPNIADVNDVSKEEIVISPKAAGATTLVVWDSLGERSYRIRVLSEDISEIKRRIDSLLKSLGAQEVYTREARDEGKVLLLGRVKTPQERERILTATGALKDKIIDLIEIIEESAAVDIDVQIIELTRDGTKALGFTMPSTVSAMEVPGVYPRSLYQSMDAIYHVFKWPRATNFYVTLDALVQEGKAKILSQPRISCQSGKEAELMVGGEKPILTTEEHDAGGQSTTVSYKEYGIKLKIKPIVTPDDKIKLGFKVEVSEVGEADILGNLADIKSKAYPLVKRNASTELILNDGETFAIGGLIKQKTEEDLTKTAGLGDLPIIGFLFRKRVTKVGGGFGEKGNVELFIVLTPKIIRNEIPSKDKEAEIDGVSAVAKRSIGQEAPSDPLMNYGRFIQTRILEKLNYPLLAKDAGFQGAVVLGLHLSSAGELLDVAVKSSSGYKMLDDTAVNAAKALYPYPPFPAAIKKKELWIDVPIDYRLD
jgi:pilus assembly protein CpaC